MSEKILKSIGSKNTPIREAVLQILKNNDKPLSIKDITNSVTISADESTIYRVVNFFVKQNIVNEIFIQKNATFYELSKRDDHHHLVCIECKKITDFHGCGIDDLIKNALKQNPEFKNVKSHSLELFGLCKSCA
jgi:Fur family ferric uptake transcriptional regulator